MTEDVMNRDMLDDAFHVAARIAADRNIDIDRDALVRALRVVTGKCDGQDDPTEIAEDALELLGNTLGFPASRRGRRPF